MGFNPSFVRLRPEVAASVREDERHAQEMAQELNRLVPGLLACGQGFGGDVLIGWLSPEVAERLIARLRQEDPLAPFVDAFRAGRPRRYWLDETVEGFVIRDSANGGDQVGKPYSSREDGEKELDVLLAEEDSA